MQRNVVISRILLAVMGVGICVAIYVGICNYKCKQKEETEQAIKRNNEFLKDTKRPLKPTSYEEAFKILNQNYTNEDFAAFMRMKLVHEQSNNTPFTSTELYLKWDSDYKSLFHNK
jgi:predicted negative regulator of RcsB-dependent stress response